MGRRLPERSNAQLRAERALAEGLRRSNSNAVIVGGRVIDLNDNLVPGVQLRQFESDFDGGAGRELRDKFRAPFSSSALVVNSFAPFKDMAAELVVGRFHGFEPPTFERKCPTGLRGTPPHLDLLLCGRSHALAIESKCTEHLGTKSAFFSDSYELLIESGKQSKIWLDEMMAIRHRRPRYAYLDAAQLIKHAFGLANCFVGQPITLLYLYWVPNNAADTLHELVVHKRELDAFEKRVDGGFPRFRAMTYRQLWAQWAKANRPAWLRQHAYNLRQRYAVTI